MGAANITNVTGSVIKIVKYEVNGVDLSAYGDAILPGETLNKTYDLQPWSDFSRFILQVYVNGNTYQIDLNDGHYFGGGDYHTPGSGSDVDFTLFGSSNGGKTINLLLAYRESGAPIYIASTDYSKELTLA